MSLELGLIVILFIGIILKGVIGSLFETGQDERIKELAEQNDWQDIELTRFRERIMKLEKLLQEMEERDK